MGRLDPRQAAAEDARFENLVGTSFVLLLPTAGDYSLPKRHIGDFSTGLRGIWPSLLTTRPKRYTVWTPACWPPAALGDCP